MKNSILIFLMLAAFGLNAQTTTPDPKPPKIRYTAGFLTTKYEIGDKDASQTEVRLQIEKHSTAGYYEFRRGEKLVEQSLFWLIAGAGASVAGALSEKTSSKAIWFGSSAVLCTVSLVQSLTGPSRMDKGISIYNKQFGY